MDGKIAAKAAMIAATYQEQGYFEMTHGKLCAAIKSFTKSIDNDDKDEKSFILRSKCYVR